MAAWPSDSLQLCKHPDSHGPYYGHKMCRNPVIFVGAWNLLHQLFGPLAQMIFLYCPVRWEGALWGTCGQGGRCIQKGITKPPKGFAGDAQRGSPWSKGGWASVTLAATVTLLSPPVLL